MTCSLSSRFTLYHNGRVSGTVRTTSAALLLTLAACNTAPTPDPEPESPCGPGFDAHCIERVGDVCFFDDLSLGAHLYGDITDQTIDSTMSRSTSCGFFSFTSCARGQYMGMLIQGGDGAFHEGEVVPAPSVEEYTTPLTGYAFDPDTFEHVGGGTRRLPYSTDPCKLSWYGERDAFPCFERALELLDTTYALCSLDAPTCDDCACRINEVTATQSPFCEQVP